MNGFFFNPFKPSVLFCRISGNSSKPDQTPQDAASDQVLHCLQAEVFFFNLNKNEKYHPTTLKSEMDWSNGYQWEIPFGLNGGEGHSAVLLA